MLPIIPHDPCHVEYIMDKVINAGRVVQQQRGTSVYGRLLLSQTSHSTLALKWLYVLQHSMLIT